MRTPIGSFGCLIATLVLGCAHESEGPLATASVPASTYDATVQGPSPAAASSELERDVHVDRSATEALSRMGDYLRSLPKFEVRADTSTDLVLDNGQNASYLHETVLDVQRPDRARAEVLGSRKPRGIVYDGRDFVIFNQGEGYYSRNPAPPTLNGLVHELATVYNIEMPLVNLFYWGNGKVDELVLTSAQDLGLEKVNARWCTHYAYRQQGVDWELWVERGSRPLPCRMVITDTTQESRPRHAVTYHWNLLPAFKASTFVYRPPPGAHSIELKPAFDSPLQEAQ
ncbi:DUF2092 domain-containing protein [Caballeronia sp. LZ019]|uniref:DUF2092 domain-containing protein n=1 Tax=Caballeronia sp. LZ019 TaxID=3038555 RepID=UPI0028656592|nr:DUF2092 domain-containing protein [Caballeronia sp. LZ019]MDR5809275.1 DUF2092 domain-containing protein [Caballeronia sp. LZ019]